jgi:flagellar biosynthesis/type III secretory pathway protein FliH
MRKKNPSMVMANRRRERKREEGERRGREEGERRGREEGERKKRRKKRDILIVDGPKV